MGRGNFGPSNKRQDQPLRTAGGQKETIQASKSNRRWPRPLPELFWAVFDDHEFHTHTHSPLRNKKLQQETANLRGAMGTPRYNHFRTSANMPRTRRPLVFLRHAMAGGRDWDASARRNENRQKRKAPKAQSQSGTRVNLGGCLKWYGQPLSATRRKAAWPQCQVARSSSRGGPTTSAMLSASPRCQLERSLRHLAGLAASPPPQRGCQLTPPQTTQFDCFGPKLAQIGQTRANFGRSWSNSAPNRPESDRFGPNCPIWAHNLPSFDHVLPISTASDRTRPRFGQHWPTSTGLGPI